MSVFEYVIVLLSVIISLGLARLLETHAHLLKHGKRVKWSPTYVAWLLILVLSHIDIWASLWQVHENARWSAGDIGLSLLATALLLYAAIFATPETAAEEVDLWAFHLENRRRYVGAFILYALIGAFLNASLMRDAFSTANLTAMAPITLGAMATFLFRNRWVQMVAPAIILAAIVKYFAEYLPTIS